MAAHPTGLPAGTGDPGPGGVVEIGIVASGAHGSRNRADEPCFAKGRVNFSNTLLRAFPQLTQRLIGWMLDVILREAPQDRFGVRYAES